MTQEQFCYWIQGFVELSDGAMPSEMQWMTIVDHLKTVFNKVTPVRVPSLISTYLDNPALHTATC